MMRNSVFLRENIPISFLFAPRVSTTFTFLFGSEFDFLLFPPSEIAGLRFTSQQVVVSGGFAPGVAGFGKRE